MVHLFSIQLRRTFSVTSGETKREHTTVVMKQAAQRDYQQGAAVQEGKSVRTAKLPAEERRKEGEK
jgi:hypothetical protein